MKWFDYAWFNKQLNKVNKENLPVSLSLVL